MSFANIMSGASVFLDANTIVYHFEPHLAFGAACTQLFDRIEQQDIIGVTSTHILTEAAHRLMMIEASSVHGWTKSKVKLRLLQQPTALQNLTIFRSAIESVLQSHIKTLTIDASLIVNAAAVSQQFGLLSNDALIVAVMQANGLSNLASNDADFDRVPGITRYAPI